MVIGPLAAPVALKEIFPGVAVIDKLAAALKLRETVALLLESCCAFAGTTKRTKITDNKTEAIDFIFRIFFSPVFRFFAGDGWPSLANHPGYPVALRTLRENC
jgi:hypothetical protein